MSTLKAVLKAFEKYHGEKTLVNVQYRPESACASRPIDDLAECTILSLFVSREQVKAKALLPEGDEVLIYTETATTDPVDGAREYGENVLEALSSTGEVSGKTKLIPQYLHEAKWVGIDFNDNRWSVAYLG